MAQQLRTILGQLDRELSSRWPSTYASLRPPANAADLTDLESTFGRPLLSDIRDLYRWHDGAAGITDAFQLGDDFVFLSVAQSAAERATMNQVIRDTFSEPLDAEWLWQPTWLPVGSSYAGSLLVVDHTPGDTSGRVFPVEHGNGARPDKGWPDITAVLGEVLSGLGSIDEF